MLQKKIKKIKTWQVNKIILTICYNKLLYTLNPKISSKEIGNSYFMTKIDNNNFKKKFPYNKLVYT